MNKQGTVLSTKEDEIDIKALLGKLFKHRKVILSCVITAGVIGLLLAMTATPIYKARATVLIEPDSTSKLINKDASQVASFILRKEYMETQKEILKSRNLAREIVNTLELYNTRLFNPEKKAQSKRLIERITTKLQKNSIAVDFIKDTRLVKITAVSPDPQMAMKIANALTAAYKKFVIEKKFATTRDTVKYLETQTREVKEKLAAKEQQLQSFGAEKEIFYVNKDDNALLTQYSEINNAFSQAQIEKIRAESAYNRLKKMNFQDFPAVINNPIIQRLKEQYSGLESEYIKKRETFKDDYPAVKDLKAQLNSLEKRIRIESRNIAGKHLRELQNTFQSNQEKVLKLKEQMKTYQDKISSSNTEVITYNTIKIEAENLKHLLNYMTNKLNETIVSARLSGLTTSNIKVVDRAELPRIPFKPRKKMILLIALFLGAAVGVGLVFVLDFFKDTVSSAEELQNLTQKPVLATIPDMLEHNGKAGKYNYHYAVSPSTDTQEIRRPELLLHEFPDHLVSESYRTLRTALLFSRGESPPKVISVTSTLPSEGKTTTIANLGCSFARLDEKVLLIDGDMRKPKLHKIFEVKNHNGLSEVLTGNISYANAIKQTQVNNLLFLNSGTIPPNPSELLNAPVFGKLIADLTQEYDRILIDSPPVVPVVDPLIIGNLVDGLILVVFREKSSRKELSQCMEKLANSGVSMLGVIDNKVESNGFKKYSSYKKYKS